jgi:hypothetical protein
MSCNAIACFSSAVKRVSLGTEASQRILKVIDRIPKISLKSVILDSRRPSLITLSSLKELSYPIASTNISELLR